MSSTEMTTQPEKDRKIAEVFEKLSEALEKNNEVIEGAFTMLTQVSQLIQQEREAIAEFGKSKDKKGPKEEIEREEQVIVEVKVTFCKIMDIDTLLENYAAEVFLQAKWEDPSFDDAEKVYFDKKKHWEPQIIVVNLQQELEAGKKRFQVRRGEPGYKHAVVFMSWRFKAVFKERLELRHFPFDVQDLTLTMSSERTYEEVTLVPDKHSLSSVNVDAFQDASEWSIYEHVESSLAHSGPDAVNSAVSSMVHVTCRVRRRMGYFLWNIVVIMLLIVTLSFALTVIDPGRVDRMALSLTLFLTAIAFKLACTSSLPTISYLTYLDTYVLLSLFFLGSMILWNAFIFSMSEKGLKNYKMVDNTLLGGLGGLVIFFHIAFALYIYSTAFMRRRDMEEKDMAYEKQRNYLTRYGVVLPLDHFYLEIK